MKKLEKSFFYPRIGITIYDKHKNNKHASLKFKISISIQLLILNVCRTY